MSHTIARITSDEDGETIKKEDQRWCYVEEQAGTRITLCTGEVFDLCAAIADVKEVKRGGITCMGCLSVIKKHKSIKL